MANSIFFFKSNISDIFDFMETFQDNIFSQSKKIKCANNIEKVKWKDHNIHLLEDYWQN